jgi:hypothetical protein
MVACEISGEASVFLSGQDLTFSRRPAAAIIVVPGAGAGVLGVADQRSQLVDIGDLI